MKHLWMILFLVLPVICAAQTVQITDQSAAGAPVSLTGTASFSPTGFSVGLNGHNGSSKDLILVVADLTITLPSGLTKPPISLTHDHYFTSELIASGADIMLADPSFTHPIPIEIASAQARLLYVQFADGSPWGDATGAGAKYLSLRAIRQNFFSKLLSAYSSQGAAGLDAALAQPPSPEEREVAATMKGEREMLGSPDLLAEKLKKYLSNAAVHQAAFIQ